MRQTRGPMPRSHGKRKGDNVTLHSSASFSDETFRRSRTAQWKNPCEHRFYKFLRRRLWGISIERRGQRREKRGSPCRNINMRMGMKRAFDGKTAPLFTEGTSITFREKGTSKICIGHKRKDWLLLHVLKHTRRATRPHKIVPRKNVHYHRRPFCFSTTLTRTLPNSKRWAKGVLSLSFRMIFVSKSISF